MNRVVAFIALLVLASAATAQTDESVLNRVVEVNIPAQPLASAIIELSKQTGTQILAPADAVNGHNTGGVRGAMPLREALTQLLQGTLLRFRAAGANTIGIDAGPVIPLAEESVTPQEDVTFLDDITVTSGKRVKAQRDIPGSVGVIRGDDLEKMKAQGLADYVKLVPGVVILDRGVDSAYPIIRGISTSTGFVGSSFSQLPVGIFVDDMPFTDLYIPFTQPDLNPFDLERVEILKGPQGTLFGSGALSGAIRYIVQKPKPAVWEGKLSATAVSSAQAEGHSPVLAGALNAPLFGDEAALRVVGVYRKGTGITDDTDEAGAVVKRDIDRLDQFNGRVLANWDVSERLQLEGFYFLQDTQSENSPFTDNPRSFERAGNGVGALVQESGFGGGNIVARYAFDGADFFSSSNYLTKDAVFLADGPAGHPGPFCFFDLTTENILPDRSNRTACDPDGDGGANGPGSDDAGQSAVLTNFYTYTDSLFQEFRLASPEGSPLKLWDWISMEWLLGAAYQRSDQFVRTFSAALAVEQAAEPVNAQPVFPIVTPQGPIYGSREASVVDAGLTGIATETALFGEATAMLGKHWEATLGGRLFQTRLDSNGYYAGAQIFLLDAGRTETYFDRKVKEEGFNPKASLRYLFNEQVQLYALAAKGFQFGGVQLNPPVIGLTVLAGEGFAPYKSSTLWNYEVGLRTEFFERRLKWDTTLFYLDWTDLQITIRRPVAPMGEELGLTSGFTENIGAAKSQGVETALSISPLRGLSFTSSAAWIKAVTTEGFESLQGNVPANTRLPGAPRFQLANVLSYATPFNFLGNWEGGLSLTHSHLGASFNTLQYVNQPGYEREQGGYDTLDASVALLKPGMRFVPDLTLSMLNVTDVRGASVVSSGPGGGGGAYFLVRPRTLLMSLGLKF